MVSGVLSAHGVGQRPFSQGLRPTQGSRSVQCHQLYAQTSQLWTVVTPIHSVTTVQHPSWIPAVIRAAMVQSLVCMLVKSSCRAPLANAEPQRLQDCKIQIYLRTVSQHRGFIDESQSTTAFAFPPPQGQRNRALIVRSRYQTVPNGTSVLPSSAPYQVIISRDASGRGQGLDVDA
jgi:hypothetical protein